LTDQSRKNKPMPTRDDQDWERRRQQIIDGALHVFAHKGFEKATNRDIADAAGIGSPGLIYHYFKDKADLLRQVIEHYAPILSLLADSEHLMDRPPREVLTQFSLAFTTIMTNPRTIALLRLLLGEALRRPVVADMMNKIGPGRGLAFLTRYFQHQMDLGVLRRVDPGAAARCFVGPLLAFVITREVFPQPDSRALTPEMMVQTNVDLFLRGMLVQPES
jgi:TetR/AcrR family transcriptional regulator, mexJK operon transcriptional repressor